MLLETWCPTKFGFQATNILSNRKFTPSVTHRNYPGSKFLRKPNLLTNQNNLGTHQGVFQKEETKGYLNKNFKGSVKTLNQGLFE